MTKFLDLTSLWLERGNTWNHFLPEQILFFIQPKVKLLACKKGDVHMYIANLFNR